MVAFVIGRPVKTTAATVTVDAGLAPGVHRFSLEVIDGRGRSSVADVVEVVVVRALVPTPPVPPVRPLPVPPVVRPVPPLPQRDAVASESVRRPPRNPRRSRK